MTEGRKELIKERQVAASKLVRLQITARSKDIVQNGSAQPGPVAKGDWNAV